MTAKRIWLAAVVFTVAMGVATTSASAEVGGANQELPLGVNAQPRAELFMFEETCTEKLMAYITAKGMGGNNLFRKTDRDFFETQTGCIVEATNAVAETTGLYAQEKFPGLSYFGYEIVDARENYPGGSYGSIPGWTLVVLLEYEIEQMNRWGLCGQNWGDTWNNGSSSADLGDPDWASSAALRYASRNPDFQNWPGTTYYQSRYAISQYREILVTDQQGPVISEVVWACGTDPIFQNALDEGYHQINTKFYLDPADLAEYEIPFYSWMGW